MTRHAILKGEEQAVTGAILAFGKWRTFAADTGLAVRLQKQATDATMCAINRPVHSDLLDFAGLSSNLAYITSVFIGYIGTDSIGSLIKRFAAKKPEKMV